MPRNLIPLVLVVALLGIGAYVAKVLLLPRIAARQTAASSPAEPAGKGEAAPLEAARASEGRAIAEEPVGRPSLRRPDGPPVGRPNPDKEVSPDAVSLPRPQPPTTQAAAGPTPRPSPALRPEPPAPLSDRDGGPGEDGMIVSWSLQERLMRKYLEALEYLKD